MSQLVTKLTDKLELKEGQLARVKERAKTSTRRAGVAGAVLAGAAAHGIETGLDVPTIGEARYSTLIGMVAMLAGVVDDDPKDLTGDLMAAGGAGMVAPEFSNLVSRHVRDMKK